MYTLTVNIADSGTPFSHANSDGSTKSLVGHMFYEIDNGIDEHLSRGFAPKKSEIHYQGKIFIDDNTHYTTRAYTKTIPITQEQYKVLKDFGEHPEYYHKN